MKQGFALKELTQEPVQALDRQLRHVCFKSYGNMSKLVNLMRA